MTTTLRDRLTEMGAKFVEAVVRDGVEPSFIAMLANVTGALDALDCAPVEAEPADRAVVADDGGELIRLTLYAGVGAVTAVNLDPVRAVAFAGPLIEVAHWRLRSA